ncbi:MAG: hypothetical protein ACOX87_11590 [Chloroflexota bacterium]
MLEDEIEYFKVSADRISAIVELTGLPVLRVREICMAPWPDAKVHQQWLDESSVEEIAQWVLHIDKLEKQGEE